MHCKLNCMSYSLDKWMMRHIKNVVDNKWYKQQLLVTFYQTNSMSCSPWFQHIRMTVVKTNSTICAMLYKSRQLSIIIKTKNSLFSRPLLVASIIMYYGCNNAQRNDWFNYKQHNNDDYNNMHSSDIPWHILVSSVVIYCYTFIPVIN